MSAEDRQRWEQRYREGAYGGRPDASEWLRQQPLQPTPGARALDVACGLGRNTRYLAQLGYQVDALDIAAEALQRARVLASDLPAARIRWLQHDLDQDLPADLLAPGYDVILIMRYLQLSLLAPLKRYLRPGGLLFCEVHLQFESDLPLAGPARAAFRAAPGALLEAAQQAGFAVVGYDEGLFTDPDGRQVALARLQASK